MTMWCPKPWMTSLYLLPGPSPGPSPGPGSDTWRTHTLIPRPKGTEATAVHNEATAVYNDKSNKCQNRKLSFRPGLKRHQGKLRQRSLPHLGGYWFPRPTDSPTSLSHETLPVLGSCVTLWTFKRRKEMKCTVRPTTDFFADLHQGVEFSSCRMETLVSLQWGPYLWVRSALRMESSTYSRTNKWLLSARKTWKSFQGINFECWNKRFMEAMKLLEIKWG